MLDSLPKNARRGLRASHDRRTTRVRHASADRIKEKSPSLRRGASRVWLPGQYFDAETGLHYNYFRDYEPATGRYVESDPAGQVGGVNTFLYCKNQPTFCVDKFGLVGSGFAGAENNKAYFWKWFHDDVCKIFPNQCSGASAGDGLTYKQRCITMCAFELFFGIDNVAEKGLDSGAGYLMSGCKELARFYTKRIFFVKDVIGTSSCIGCCSNPNQCEGGVQTFK